MDLPALFEDHPDPDQEITIVVNKQNREHHASPG
jgi:hypothetical protein